MTTSLMLLSPWMALGLNVVSHLSSKSFSFCSVKQGRYSSGFQVWWGSHEGNCSVKFVGSSTAMKSEDALIWKRLTENLNL